MITQEIVVTEQDVIDAIDRIVSDEFCETLDIRAAFKPETMTETEKICHEKLSLAYRIAHSFNRSHSCYRVHGAWRELVRWPLPENGTASAAPRPAGGKASGADAGGPE